MFQHLSKRWKVFVLCIFLFIVLYALHALWLPVLGRLLVVGDNLQKSDVIIVLGTHTKGQRVDWASKLYKRGLAKNIIMCGYQVGWKTSSAEIMKRQALGLGIPDEAIILDYGWENHGTWDHAINSLSIVTENNFKTAIVVTSNYHTRRSRLAFNKIFKDTNVRILMSPCPGGSYGPGQWWKSRKLIESVFLEYVKLIYYSLFPPHFASNVNI